VDGERLTQDEILEFFQLLLVGGQETTANLLNNAILCLLDNPDQPVLLRRNMQLLPSAIEEVLRYRSPLQWVMRTPRRSFRRPPLPGPLLQRRRRRSPRGRTARLVLRLSILRDRGRFCAFICVVNNQAVSLPFLNRICIHCAEFCHDPC
jgi:hypothetical protein